LENYLKKKVNISCKKNLFEEYKNNNENCINKEESKDYIKSNIFFKNNNIQNQVIWYKDGKYYLKKPRKMRNCGFCNCVNNKCLKGYCVCFNKGKFCEPKKCRCMNCKNFKRKYFKKDN
jgi:hypothetical protein